MFYDYPTFESLYSFVGRELTLAADKDYAYTSAQAAEQSAAAGRRAGAWAGCEGK